MSWVLDYDRTLYRLGQSQWRTVLQCDPVRTDTVFVNIANEAWLKEGDHMLFLQLALRRPWLLFAYSLKDEAGHVICSEREFSVGPVDEEWTVTEFRQAYPTWSYQGQSYTTDFFTPLWGPEGQLDTISLHMSPYFQAFRVGESQPLGPYPTAMTWLSEYRAPNGELTLSLNLDATDGECQEFAEALTLLGQGLDVPFHFTDLPDETQCDRVDLCLLVQFRLFSVTLDRLPYALVAPVLPGLKLSALTHATIDLQTNSDRKISFLFNSCISRGLSSTARYESVLQKVLDVIQERPPEQTAELRHQAEATKEHISSNSAESLPRLKALIEAAERHQKDPRLATLLREQDSTPSGELWPQVITWILLGLVVLLVVIVTVIMLTRGKQEKADVRQSLT